ncbi:MAG: hypothetical protein U0414_27015 [Polyangiaceae bacterium]
MGSGLLRSRAPWGRRPRRWRAPRCARRGVRDLDDGGEGPALGIDLDLERARELLHGLTRGRDADARIARDAPEEEHVERVRELDALVARALRRAGDRLGDELLHDREARLALPERGADETSVRDEPERPDVRRGADLRLPIALLRRHVRDRPARHRPALRRLFDDLRDTEVEDLHDGVLARLLHDEDVLGFDVAVDDPGLVRGVQGDRRLPQELDEDLRLERAVLGEDLAEIAALEVLHHEERRALRIDPGVDDVDDVIAVLDARADLRLPEEALDEDLLRAEVGKDPLQREALLRVRVPDDVDFTHPPALEEVLDLVFVECVPGLEHRGRILVHRPV